MKSPKVDASVNIMAGAVIAGDVVIGAGSSVWCNAVIRADMGSAVIGKGSNVQDCCVIHMGSGGRVEIGDNVSVGHGCILHGCTIKNGALIGMGSIVLDGAVIGENSMIGAGSLVTKDTVIPEGALAFGRPAKVVRQLTAEEIAANAQNAAGYVKLAKETP